MKLISVKFWIAHKPLNVNENASYPASGLEILAAPHYAKEINQKASEI